MAESSEGEFADIRVNGMSEDDVVGPHAIDDVVRWASRLLDAHDPRAMRVIEGLRNKQRGRLIVMKHPEDGSEWGPIGFVLPVTAEMDCVLIAFITGGMYVVEPVGDDEKGYVSGHFAQMYYPNSDPIYVWGTNVRHVEQRMVNQTLPFDRSTMLTNRDPSQREEVDDAVVQALSVAQSVQFDALQRESMEGTSGRLYDGLGRILGMDGELD